MSDRPATPPPPAHTRAPVVRVRDLSVRRGGRTVLRGVSLNVPGAAVTALAGPSGP